MSVQENASNANMSSASNIDGVLFHSAPQMD